MTNLGHNGHQHGYLGIACINTCKSNNYGGLVRAAHNFDVDLLMFINRRFKQQASNTTKGERHIPLIEYIDSDDFIKHIPIGARLVSIEITDNSADLSGFVHPKQCIYVFGPEDGSIPQRILDVSAAIVQIPSHHCLNLACAVSVVLWDRLIKETSKVS